MPDKREVLMQSFCVILVLICIAIIMLNSINYEKKPNKIGKNAVSQKEDIKNIRKITADIQKWLNPLFEKNDKKEYILYSIQKEAKELCFFLELIYIKCKKINEIKLKEKDVVELKKEILKKYPTEIKKINEGYLKEDCGEEALKLEKELKNLKLKDSKRKIKVYSWLAYNKIKPYLNKLK